MKKVISYGKLFISEKNRILQIINICVGGGFFLIKAKSDYNKKIKYII